MTHKKFVLTAIRALFHFLIAVVTFAVWLHMVFRPVSGAFLVTNGLATLKFYTVLSNLLNGAASAVLCAELVLILRGKRGAVSRGAFLLNYVGTAAVAVTFLVVLCFLGPAVGHALLYHDANFWFHLVLPVFSIAEFLVLERDHRITFRQMLLVCIPPLLYGLGYLINLLINGIGGAWPNSNDFYGFAAHGIPAGLVIFAVIVLIAWLCGLLLALPCRKRKNLDRISPKPL